MDLSKMSKEEKRHLVETQGFVQGDVWGGPRKKRYYTPDGRVVYKPPSEREFQRLDKNGKVVEQGIRDANYDEGLLDTMPTELKLYCRWCDKWHDTEQQIEDCKAKQKKLETWGMEMARRMHPKDFEKADKMAEFEDRLNKQDEKLDAILKAVGGK